MKLGSRFRAFEQSSVGRWILVGVGGLCVIAAPIIAPLPGPGGIPLLLAGITLMLRYTRWAKRLYARAKRRWPKHGALADRGLRRPSAKRRVEMAKQQAD